MSHASWVVIPPFSESLRTICTVCLAGRFDEVLIRHQVKYLGLMENLRVRRAGFAYRRKYEAFLQRWVGSAHREWVGWEDENLLEPARKEGHS